MVATSGLKRPCRSCGQRTAFWRGFCRKCGRESGFYDDPAGVDKNTAALARRQQRDAEREAELVRTLPPRPLNRTVVVGGIAYEVIWDGT